MKTNNKYLDLVFVVQETTQARDSPERSKTTLRHPVALSMLAGGHLKNFMHIDIVRCQSQHRLVVRRNLQVQVS